MPALGHYLRRASNRQMRCITPYSGGGPGQNVIRRDKDGSHDAPNQPPIPPSSSHTDAGQTSFPFVPLRMIRTAPPLESRSGMVSRVGGGGQEEIGPGDYRADACSIAV